MRAYLRVFWIAAQVMCIAACSSSDPKTQIETKDGVTSATFVASKAGGLFELPGGASLEIPDGALAAETTITVSAPADQTAAARFVRFRFQPDGLVFAKSATLTVPYADDDDGNEPTITAQQYSSSNPLVDLGSEQSRIVDMQPVARDEEKNTIALRMDHFSFVWLAVAVHKYAYVVKHIPPKYLKPGDVLFALTQTDNHPNWKPGHVGIFAGGSTPCKPGESDKVIESTPPKVTASKLSSFKADFGHVYMGARGPGGGENLTAGDRLGIVQFCENVLGKQYSLIGQGNLSNAAFSCVGLAEAAYDSVNKGTLPGLVEAFAATPLEMFLVTSPVTKITMEAGDRLAMDVHGVIVHPDSTAWGTTFRGWYCYSYPCKGKKATNDHTIVVKGLMPEGATFERGGSGHYRFVWQSSAKDAGKKVFLTFELTSEPHTLGYVSGSRSVGKQVVQDTLFIEVVPCPARDACLINPQNKSALDTGEKLEVQRKEVCGALTAKAIAFLIHSSAKVPKKAVAKDHTTLKSLGAISTSYVKQVVDLLFNNSEFDCGTGANGLTVCPPGSTAVPAGDFFVLFNVLDGNVPLADPTNTYQYGFAFDADGSGANNYRASTEFPNDFFDNTDRWYEVNYDPSNGWQLKVSDAAGGTPRVVTSNARAVIKDNVIVLVVPRAEFSVAKPPFRVTAFRHSGDFGLNPPHNFDGSLWPPVGQPLEPMP